MLQWFRRKKDNKALAMNAEQEISTIKKTDMIDKANECLDKLFMDRERRFHDVPVQFERRRAT